jgi:uncharacterized glyoxalase superfamily protein PhnB
MKPTPAGWPRISSAVFYEDPRAAIDWLCRVFGFEVRLLVEGEGGRVEHSELTYGDGLIMVGGAGPAYEERPGTGKVRKSPRMLGGANTQCMMVFVDDADAHAARVKAQGGTVTVEPETHDYGDDYWADRSYAAVDLEGHSWWFTQRVRDPQPQHGQ